MLSTEDANGCFVLDVCLTFIPRMGEGGGGDCLQCNDLLLLKLHIPSTVRHPPIPALIALPCSCCTHSFFFYHSITAIDNVNVCFNFYPNQTRHQYRFLYPLLLSRKIIFHHAVSANACFSDVVFYT